jgi:hypothetical protein
LTGTTGSLAGLRLLAFRLRFSEKLFDWFDTNCRDFGFYFLQEMNAAPMGRKISFHLAIPTSSSILFEPIRQFFALWLRQLDDRFL